MHRCKTTTPLQSTQTPTSASPQYDGNFDVPTVAESEAVVRGLKNGKAAGEDFLRPELFKFSPKAWLHRGNLEVRSHSC